MDLALVRLTKVRGERKFTFLDYVSADVAKLDVQIQGENHGKDEWSDVEILKIFKR